MLAPRQVTHLRIPPPTLDGLRRYAARAEIGGVSRVREGAERSEHLSEDQLVGQVAQLAACRVLFGTDRHYLHSRQLADAHPSRGDGGCDVPGLNLDVKGSLLRASSRSLSDYHLAVRAQERSPGKVYVLVLVDLPVALGEDAVAHVMGWAEDRELPTQPEKVGPFAGAFLVPARALHPLPPFRWDEKIGCANV